MPHNTFLFEANLSGERIYKILNQSIVNMRMLVALEQFRKENWEALRTTMSPFDFVIITNICRKYLSSENLPIAYKGVIDEEQKLTESDSEISMIMKILNKNKAASEYCLSTPISTAATLFIEFMEKLQEYFKERIHKSAEMEKKRASHLKQLYEQNVAMSETLVKLQNKIDIIESQKKTIQSAKESDMTKHNLEIESIRRKFNARVEERIEESENQMICDWKNSEFRQAALIEEVNTQQTFFDNLLKERLVKEKELRIRRYKVESQLVAILEKYDNDIGDRNRQIEELTAQLEEEKLELDQLQYRFYEQEILYNNLMTEKEIHEKRVFDEKLYAIRSKISARIIQRRFRKYLERKAKGKKKGKGKGGKGKKK